MCFDIIFIWTCNFNIFLGKNLVKTREVWLKAELKYELQFETKRAPLKSVVSLATSSPIDVTKWGFDWMIHSHIAITFTKYMSWRRCTSFQSWKLDRVAVVGWIGAGPGRHLLLLASAASPISRQVSLPSSILSTSRIVGLSIGECCVQRSTIWISDSTSACMQFCCISGSMSFTRFFSFSSPLTCTNHVYSLLCQPKQTFYHKDTTKRKISHKIKVFNWIEKRNRIYTHMLV